MQKNTNATFFESEEVKDILIKKYYNKKILQSKDIEIKRYCNILLCCTNTIYCSLSLLQISMSLPSTVCKNKPLLS